MDHLEFEKKLMGMLLDGKNPVLEELKNQYSNAIVESRKFTGAGFFTHFKVKSGIKCAAGGKSFQIGDIDVIVKDIKDAIGFILFIEKGYLSTLEGYTLSSDTWPDEYSEVILAHDGPKGKRDLEKLKATWV